MKEKNLKPTEIIISQTDLKGNIIYINKIFSKISGYQYNELIGKNHNIIRHPKMPKTIFKLLWEKLKRKEEVYCFIQNSTREHKEEYWIFSHIYPSFNRDRSLRNYISTSYPISIKAEEIIKGLYRDLLLVEKERGVELATTLYKKFIDVNRYRKTQSDNSVIYNIQY